MKLEEKVGELAEKVDELQEENRQLRKRNQQLEDKVERHLGDGEQQEKTEEDSEGLSRRQFMKMLGLGAGGLALSSSAAGAWSILQPQSSGVSDIKAKTATAAAGNFDLQGNSLTDTTQGFLDFTGDGNNLRLATGQAIEDGSGQKRLNIPDTNATNIYDGGGRMVFGADYQGVVQLNSWSDQKFVLRDATGVFDAVKYLSSSSAPGTLVLTNAELRMSESARFTGTANVLSWPVADGSENPFVTSSSSGEIVAKDDSGNYTTLT
ncbi:MAG: twin-arginine translocation signal domain-containing protein [Candidatus Nanohalobium sp.]